MVLCINNLPYYLANHWNIRWKKKSLEKFCIQFSTKLKKGYRKSRKMLWLLNAMNYMKTILLVNAENICINPKCIKCCFLHFNLLLKACSILFSLSLNSIFTYSGKDIFYYEFFKPKTERRNIRNFIVFDAHGFMDLNTFKCLLCRLISDIEKIMR